MTPWLFHEGSTPLLISMPHAGTSLTPEVEAGLTDRARLLPDTDWHIPALYAFASAMGASILQANYSRFVVDLNRPADDTPLYQSATTGLFPDTLFDGEPVFRPGQEPDKAHRAWCLEQVWQSYHQQLADTLAAIKARFGYALLFDAHSIASVIPRLFDGRLPDLNIGTNHGASCAPAVSEALRACCEAQSAYTWVINGRFKGGHITRAYGDPANHIHAVQLELAQCNYMDETPPFAWQEERAAALQQVLKSLLETLVTSARAVEESHAR
ncbi:N-formylglutamate deformylase [Mangrovibacter phragmitis]|uniref:N-formylglutamate deformylase n=1 Tax=Mangrovibacter phragmitis TaxID=1691903 RepID=A0A1B7L902_9ENTR|nr:N-formylglutamate deformylase [Mangrovibacter phragmitis]OAT78796.1 N-formylglutamate deformylase [Mangrovibacter phragmitis]